MRHFWPTLRRLLRLLGPIAVVVLVVIYWEEFQVAFWQALEVGPVFLVLFPLFWAWNHVATWGWRNLIQVIDQEESHSIWHLSLIRLKAQSVNLVLPFSVGAPVLKSSLLARRNGSLTRSAASVTLDTVASTAASLLFATFSFGLHFAMIPGGVGSLWTVALLALALITVLYSTPFLAAQAYKLRWIGQDSALGRTLNHMYSAGPALKRAISSCTLSHLVEQLLMAFEIWIIAFGLGVELSFVQLAFCAAMLTGFTLVFFFIPSQAGAAEGGLALAFSLMGFPSTMGLSVGIVRRSRQISVYGAGLIILLCTEGKTILRSKEKPSFSVSRWR